MVNKGQYLKFKVPIAGERQGTLSEIQNDIMVKARKYKNGIDDFYRYTILNLILYPDKANNKVLFYFNTSRYYVYKREDEISISELGAARPDILQEYYYETTYDNFSKFLKLP